MLRPPYRLAAASSSATRSLPRTKYPNICRRACPRSAARFLQAESEVAAINMVYGAAGAGARAMTSSSSPGISLKQEGISYMVGAELPCGYREHGARRPWSGLHTARSERLLPVHARRRTRRLSHAHVCTRVHSGGGRADSDARSTWLTSTAIP